MSLLDLGGSPQQEVSDATRRVVDNATRLREERGSTETLLEAVTALEAALEGPGPHARRLESIIATLARRSPTRAEADLLDRYIDVLAALNEALHSDVELNPARELYDRALIAI